MKRLASLRTRLVLWTVALEAVLLVVLAVVSILVLQTSQNRDIDKTLRLSAEQLNAVVDVQGDGFVVPGQDAATLRENGVSAWILTPAHAVSVFIGATDSAPVPTRLPTEDTFLDTRLAGGGPVRLLAAPLTEGTDNLGTMVLAVSLAPSRAVVRQVLFSLGIAIPLVLLLSASGGLLLTKRALAPVADITETARRISAVDLSRRIDVDLRDDEIGDLTRTFNTMLGRLELSFQHERRLTSDVSHELRTPLGMLKTQLSLARSRPREAHELLDMMADMESDIDRMTRLIEQMLTLARMEQRGLDELTRLSVGALLAELCGEMRALARERSVALELIVPTDEDLHIQGDAEPLRQAFSNLIENGIKYTPAGGSVAVAAGREGHVLTVSVTDTGAGVAPDDLPHLFERFYRTDDARARDTGGFGLGLAIARATIRAHGGNIGVTSAIGEGTVFTVSLPVPAEPVSG